MSKKPRNKEINKLYMGIIRSPVLSPEVQRRIFAFGLETRDYVLLAALTTHPSLEKELEDKLRKVNSSTVLVSWVKRPGRTEEELFAMAAKEKRPTLLRELLQMEGLPATIYSIVAKNSSGKGPLISIITDEKLTSETRVEALFRLAQIASTDTRSGSDPDFDLAVDLFPQYADNVAAKTKSLALKLAALSAGELSTAQRYGILELIYQRLDSEAQTLQNKLDKAIAQMNADDYRPEKILEWLPTVALRLAYKAGFDFELMGRIIETAKLVDSNTSKYGKYYPNQLTAMVVNLKAAAGPRIAQVNYQERIAACKSEDALMAVLNEVAGVGVGIERDMAFLAVASSPLSSAEMVIKAAGQVSYHRSGLLHKVLKDPKMFAANLSRSIWMVKDTSLEKSPDPSLSYIELATTYVSKFTTNNDFLTRSEYLTPEIIGQVSPKVFLREELREEIATALQVLLESRLKNTGQWGAFESMAPTYEGTLDDLIHMITI